MTKQIVLLSLIVSATLLASSLVVALVPRASAFDPGGPPVGGAAPSVVTGNWEFINYQPTGGSYSPQNQINNGNVQYLETKWIFPFPHTAPITGQIGEGYGAKAPPLIVDGVAYVAVQDRRVYAMDAGNGRMLWTNDFPRTLKIADLKAKAGPAVVRAATIATDVHAINYYRDKGWLIPQIQNCVVYAIDAKTGKTAWSMMPEVMCGTLAEFGDPTKNIQGNVPGGFQGYVSGHAHPPQFLGNIMFIPMGGGSGQGGRNFITAFDMTDPMNPKKLYREFLMPGPAGDPNWAIDQCKKVNGNGWYFEYPKYLEGINHPARDREPTYQATKCTEVADDVVRNDWIDMVPGSPTFGKIHTASQAGSAAWGNYPIDPETGIVYIGWGDQGPYTNLTHRYGPGLHGSGFTAHDVKTGKMVWWFQSVVHDLWDFDCSWAGILGSVQGKKAYIKGCKDGIVHALDAATGKPFWTSDSPGLVRHLGDNYGVDKNNDPKGKDACCRLTKEHLGKPWMSYPDKGPIVNSCYLVCLEMDPGYDGKHVYYVHIGSRIQEIGFRNVVPFGNNGGIAKDVSADPKYRQYLHSDLYAIDVNTGKEVWRYKIDGVGYRGGLLVTGGMVVAYASDGNLKFFDAQTGKLLHEKFFGSPVNVAPTIGASKDGKMKIFAYIGGPGFLIPAASQQQDGALMTFGLPDQLPQPQVVTKEVIKEVPKEVIKEVIKEVPKEVIKTVTKEVIKEVPKEVIKEVVKEVVKEVPKEVTKTVTVETISPISYAAIGLGVVMIVVAGVLFSRRKKV